MEFQKTKERWRVRGKDLRFEFVGTWGTGRNACATGKRAKARRRSQISNLKFQISNTANAEEPASVDGRDGEKNDVARCGKN